MPSARLSFMQASHPRDDFNISSRGTRKRRDGLRRFTDIPLYSQPCIDFFHNVPLGICFWASLSAPAAAALPLDPSICETRPKTYTLAPFVRLIMLINSISIFPNDCGNDRFDAEGFIRINRLIFHISRLKKVLIALSSGRLTEIFHRVLVVDTCDYDLPRLI